MFDSFIETLIKITIFIIFLVCCLLAGFGAIVVIAAVDMAPADRLIILIATVIFALAANYLVNGGKND